MSEIKLVGFRLLHDQIDDLQTVLEKRRDGLKMAQLVRQIVAEWLRDNKSEATKPARTVKAKRRRTA